jgi:tRNA threonylcarbamoyladenosine biosynthesis protein TsaE
MNLNYSLNEIDGVAEKIIATVASKTLLFYGEMGVGKTTLIKALAKSIGVFTPVSSPTFSIVNEYEGRDCLVYHFDFYRIEDEHEVYDIGIEDYFAADAWKFIEWPDKIPNLIPLAAAHITILQTDTKQRSLTIK